MEFATVLRKKRKALNLTQQELADQLHVTRQTLSRWENNSTFPNLDTLVELSIILDIPLDNLLKGEDNIMVKQISSDVREKKKLKRYLAIIGSVFAIFLLWLCLLGYGRANQVVLIDRFNPFLSTQYGYAILPSKTPTKKKFTTVEGPGKTAKHKEWTKVPQKVDAYVSNDPFGSGEWIKFDTGMYSKNNRWALVRHKGSYVSAARLVTKKQIPVQMREQAGNFYFSYNKKTDGPRVAKRLPWWPFN